MENYFIYLLIYFAYISTNLFAFDNSLLSRDIFLHLKLS
jgi:hypothetical protein